MENISVSTFVLLDPVKGKANYFFFRLKEVKKNLAKLIDLLHIYFKKPTHSDFHYDPIPKS